MRGLLLPSLMAALQLVTLLLGVTCHVRGQAQEPSPLRRHAMPRHLARTYTVELFQTGTNCGTALNASEFIFSGPLAEAFDRPVPEGPETNTFILSPLQCTRVKAGIFQLSLGISGFEIYTPEQGADPSAGHGVVHVGLPVSTLSSATPTSDECCYQHQCVVTVSDFRKCIECDRLLAFKVAGYDEPFLGGIGQNQGQGDGLISIDAEGNMNIILDSDEDVTSSLFVNGRPLAYAQAVCQSPLPMPGHASRQPHWRGWLESMLSKRLVHLGGTDHVNDGSKIKDRAMSQYRGSIPVEPTDEGHALNTEWDDYNRAKLPYKQAFFASATIDGRIYVAGGVDEKLEVFRSALSYSPLDEGWRPIASMPTPRYNTAYAALGRFLYVFGGRNTVNQGPLATVERYDTARDMWQTLPDMPGSRECGCAVSLGHYILIAGGFTGIAPSTTFVEQVIRFNAQLERYKTVAAIDSGRARAGLACAGIGTKAYFVGGRTTTGPPYSELGSLVAFVDVYDFTMNSWQQLAALPFEVAMPSLIAISPDELLLAGGAVYAEGPGSEIEVSDQTYIYHLNAATWQPLASMKHKAFGSGLVMLP